MPRPTISNLRAAGDFATTVHWNVRFANPPALLGSLDSDRFNLRCESSDMPRRTGTSTEVMIRGARVKQPGIYLPTGIITLAMIETVDNWTSSFIRNWREIVYESGTGNQARKEDVEAVLQLVRLDRQDNEIWEYTMTGVYLEDYDPGGQLQGQSAEVLRPQLTLSYDDFTDRPV